MSSKITALTTLPSVTNSDFLVAARSTDSENYKLPVNSLFSTLTNIGYDTPVYLIDNISSTNSVAQRGLKSLSSIVTLAVATSGSTKNVTIDIDESAIDLSLCDNSTSGFLTSVNVGTATGILPIANGGTGLNTFGDKSVIITQDSGTPALESVQLVAPGGLIIGGSNGPAPGLISAGNSNVTIINTDNQIAISSTFTTATANVDMNGYNIDIDNGWVSADGTDGGVAIDSDMVYVGTDANEFYETSLNVDTSITLGGGREQTIQVRESSNPAPFNILGPSNSVSGSNAGLLDIKGGSALGNGAGGSVRILGGSSVSGTEGSVVLGTHNGTTPLTCVVIDATETLVTEGDLRVSSGDFRLTQNGAKVYLPGGEDNQKSGISSDVTINAIAGKITLAANTFTSGTQQQFTVTNSTVTANSVIILTVQGPEAASQINDSIILAQIARVVNGSFEVVLSNIGDADTDSNPRIIHFLVIN